MRQVFSGRIAAAVTSALLAFAGTAGAETIYGLSVPAAGTQQVIRVDSASPGTLIGTAVISGTTSNESIVDIDVFPVTAQLFGVGATTGTLYTINPLTGAATVNVVPSASIGTPQDVDFNPSADRLRVASAGNANYRVTPVGFNNAGLTAGGVSADGTYAFAAGDVNATATPVIVGNAYTNNFDGAAATSLYSIDTGVNVLALHTVAPTFNTMTTVAPLTLAGNPFDVGSNVGFDISGGTGIAYLSNGSALYSLNLTSGLATSLGSFPTSASIQSIAVNSVPEPGSIATALGLAAAGLLRRRARA